MPEMENSLVPRCWACQREEGLAAVVDDPWHRCKRLGVVDGGRFAVQTVTCRERRLEPGLALLALDRLQQPGLLAADIGAVAVVGMQFEREIGAEDVLAQIAGRTRLVQRLLEQLVFGPDFAVDVVVPVPLPTA